MRLGKSGAFAYEEASKFGKVYETVAVDGKSFPVGASVGLAITRSDEKSVDTALSLEEFSALSRY